MTSSSYRTNAEDSDFLGLVAQRVPANIFVFNLQTGTSEFNSAAVATLIGYSNEDIVQFGDKLLQNLLHPDDLQTAQTDLMNATTLNGDAFSTPVEYRMKAKNGEWVWFASTLRVFDRDENGNVRRVIGAAHQISRQKQAEGDLRDSVELLDAVLNLVPSGILGLDADGTIISINQTGRKLLGTQDVKLPFKWPDQLTFLDPLLDAIPTDRTPIYRTLKNETIDAELHCLVKDAGEVRYLNVSNGRNALENSQIRFLILFDDVTDQEKQRQKIERSNRLDAIGQLTGGIAHDFNNLLASVQYALELTRTDYCTEKQSGYIQTALDSVSSGADLTQRLLTFAKQQPGLRRSRNVEQILHNISRMAHPLIEAQINFETAPPSEDLWVYCDPAQLDNALINLIINARDAILSSNQGDTITLFARSVPQVDADSTLRREHPNSYIAQGQIDEHQSDQTRQDNTSYRYIEFGVTDNGPGMSKEVKRRAVDPFFTTKDHGSGTGLGLSMVYGFVEQSSGELRIYSEADQGTTIRVLLPRGDESGNREEPVKLIRQKTGNGEKILLVEDDPHLLSLMNDLVSTLGYQTTCARSGAHALALVAADQSFDLMITDIVMPGNMDGFELAARMQEAQPTTRLLYMSGYTGYSKKDMGKVIAPLLQKPCGPVELGEAISEALRTQST